MSTLRSNSGARAFSPALVSPSQGIRWTYEDLAGKVRGLSRGLQDRGIGEEDVVVTDMPSVAETLLLYLACSRIGAALSMARSPNALKALPEARLAVSTSITSLISQQRYPALPLFVDSNEMKTMLAMDHEDDSPLDDDTNELAALHVIGYFGDSAKITNEEALDQGNRARRYLKMTESDVSFVPVSLFSEFGIGTACTSTILSGASIVLPAVGGLIGCGDPMMRARETVKIMFEEKCTLLFADGSTMKIMNDKCVMLKLAEAEGGNIKNGLYKSGRGSDVLSRRVSVGNCVIQSYGSAGRYGDPIEID
jgi:acyl-CoA synthetase (AMP-forming)/AMP-acid ligase II